MKPSDVRRRTMQAVKSRNTSIELQVRRLLHMQGYRYRLYREDLPGKPDIVLPRFKKVIFVHGCFWHGHNCQRGRRVPKTNTDYWVRKINNNCVRDKEMQKRLRVQGWLSLVIWECELRDVSTLSSRLNQFLALAED